MFRPRFPIRPALLALALISLNLPVSVHAQSKSALGNLSASFEELSTRVTRGVVQIFATGYGPGSDAGDLLSKQRSSGSGVILDSDGYIVTNAHVVDGARSLRVLIPLTEEKLAGKRSILKVSARSVGAQIVGVDRETDLAVIRVQEKNLHALTLSDSDDVKQGQIVLAFGSPLGLENSVTMGVVSSVARQLVPEAPVVYIQTDATINPGNSGGPLVNADGEVVGINTLIFTQSGGSEGIGFAVPSNIVRNVFQQIRSTGRVRRGEIGVSAQTITPMMARGLGLPQDWGVVLGDVYPGSPAEKAGLLRGDVIVTLEGKVMENGRQMDVNLYRHKVGSKVKIEYRRGDQHKSARVSVTERPDDPERFTDLVRPEDNLVEKLGILALDVTPGVARLLSPLRHSQGVVVAAWTADSPARGRGFVPGDVIFGINGVSVGDLHALRNTMKGFSVGDAVVVEIQRATRLRYVTFEIE